MAEIKNTKLDLAVPIQRTGAFPIDKSSIFESYEDALAYAQHNGTDSRKLGKSSYIGQYIAAYKDDKICAYIIVAIGENAKIQKLLQIDADKDVEQDIQNLSAVLLQLEERLAKLESREEVVDTNTTYAFDTAADKDGAIRVVSTDIYGNTESQEVRVKGWEHLVAIAAGRNRVFVYDNKNDTKYLLDTKTPDTYRIGDFIYYRDLNIQDEWISKTSEDADEHGLYCEFSPLEFELPDLQGYLTEESAEVLYVKIADLNAIKNALNARINENVNKIENKADKETVNNIESALTKSIEELTEQVNSIDVDKQVNEKFALLSVENVGGEEDSYIKSIEQVGGKVIAESAKLYNYSEDIQKAEESAIAKAEQKTLEEAEKLCDKIKEKYEDLSQLIINLQSYVNVVKESLTTDSENKNTNLLQKLQSLEAEHVEIDDKLVSMQSTVTESQATVKKSEEIVNKFNSTLTQNSNKLINIDSKLAEINNRAEKNVIESILVCGVEQSIEDKKLNITEISTDALRQGADKIILNGNTW